MSLFTDKMLVWTSQCDIWSLAITSIELALGEPPNSHLDPMQAVFVIPSAQPPALPVGDEWSDNFRDFLAKCLQKDPKLRPSAAELLRHPFVALEVRWQSELLRV